MTKTDNLHVLSHGVHRASVGALYSSGCIAFVFDNTAPSIIALSFDNVLVAQGQDMHLVRFPHRVGRKKYERLQSFFRSLTNFFHGAAGAPSLQTMTAHALSCIAKLVPFAEVGADCKKLVLTSYDDKRVSISHTLVVTTAKQTNMAKASVTFRAYTDLLPKSRAVSSVPDEMGTDISKCVVGSDDALAGLGALSSLFCGYEV